MPMAPISPLQNPIGQPVTPVAAEGQVGKLVFEGDIYKGSYFYSIIIIILYYVMSYI